MKKISNKKTAQILTILVAVFIFIRSVGKDLVSLQYYTLWFVILVYIAFLLFFKTEENKNLLKQQTKIQRILNETVTLLKIIAITIFLCILIKIMPAFLITKLYSH
ncbi:hypothetical protein [Pedobacter sp.]